MRLRRRADGTRRTGTRLFVAYALASLVPVVGLGAVLAHPAEQAGTTRALAQGRAQAAVISQMAIAPSLDGDDLRSGLTRTELTRLQQATDLALYSGSLDAVRLRSFTGTVVYSDDGSRSSALASTDPAFRTAARGGTSISVTPDRGDGSPRSICVLQPIVPNATGEATGVLELYLPYAPIAAAVRTETKQTYERLGAGLVVLYLVLAAIAWSTTRSLRRHAEQQAYQATHDPLTGLPNRSAFRAFATDAIDNGERGGSIVLVDLNRFKEVNDVLGHHAGDELLDCVAERLVGALRTDDHVARLGGDEFGIVLPGATDHEHIVQLLDEVHRRLAVEVEISGSLLRIEASLGVAIYPEHGTDMDQLLKDADAAMYQAKRGVRPTVIFEPGIATTAPHSHELQVELQHALDDDQLELHYQPKLDLETNTIVGVEALVRWNHPTRGQLPPSEFVPVAESSGLVEPFTTWVLTRALSDLRQWRAAGESWSVSVNVSARNLEADGFVDVVLEQLRQCHAEPSDLVVELTETMLASDSDTLHANIRALAAEGVAVSVDDFGTGSSGLMQLRGVTVGEIKLDRVFVRELADNANDQNLARAVVQLAHGMNCTVVAEGVEDAAAAAYLQSVDCDQVQGFYYQRPVPWQQLVTQQPAASPHLAEAPARSMEVVAT